MISDVKARELRRAQLDNLSLSTSLPSSHQRSCFCNVRYRTYTLQGIKGVDVLEGPLFCLPVLVSYCRVTNYPTIQQLKTTTIYYVT